ncbi:MAG: PadR family transcriptional regulator [Candidatus Lokiarchaeota archaeon]|nr:PadR family transcriptional regulator [Candidatus Lokiarchaeota archaeon]
MYNTQYSNLVFFISKSKNSSEQIINNWIKQLRKGILELAILSYVKNKESKTYGYELIKNMKNNNINIDSNTMYPILRRLEKSKLIESLWKTQNNQPRKLFKITEEGKFILSELRKEWNIFYRNTNKIINKEN